MGNLDHEMLLLQLWTLLQPDTPLLMRVTKQWQSIGFQGEDPKTDFRGMGMLGLSNLVYFAKEFTSAARHILSHSHHPQFGYSFAIVGINLTHMAYKLLHDGALKPHMFNINPHKPTIENFHHFYSYCSLNLTNSGWSVSPETLWSSTESEIFLRTTSDLSFRI